VIGRFCLRMTILVIFAAFGSIGFGRSLAALLGMSTILCAVIGTMRREPPFDMVLNHWDETVAYAALFSLSAASIPPFHSETARSYTAPMRSPSGRPRIHIRAGRYWEHESSSLPRDGSHPNIRTERIQRRMIRGLGSTRYSPRVGIPT